MRWTLEELKSLGLGFKPGSTNREYRTILDSKNTNEIEQEPLDDSIVQSFKDGK